MSDKVAFSGGGLFTGIGLLADSGINETFMRQVEPVVITGLEVSPDPMHVLL